MFEIWSSGNEKGWSHAKKTFPNLTKEFELVMSEVEVAVSKQYCLNVGNVGYGKGVFILIYRNMIFPTIVGK